MWQEHVSVLTRGNELFLHRAAPAQPPLNVEWTLIGSQLSLYWEPVVAMDSESEVTGYQVSVTLSGLFIPREGLTSLSGGRPVRMHVYNVSPALFLPPVQLSYRRQRHKEVNTLTTANSTAELTLAEEEDDYIIQIQTLSEGGLGPASDPIRIHQLSKLSQGWRGYVVKNRKFRE